MLTKKKNTDVPLEKFDSIGGWDDENFAEPAKARRQMVKILRLLDKVIVPKVDELSVVMSDVGLKGSQFGNATDSIRYKGAKDYLDEKLNEIFEDVDKIKNKVLGNFLGADVDKIIEKVELYLKLQLENKIGAEKMKELDIVEKRFFKESRVLFRGEIK